MIATSTRPAASSNGRHGGLAAQPSHQAEELGREELREQVIELRAQLRG